MKRSRLVNFLQILLVYVGSVGSGRWIDDTMLTSKGLRDIFFGLRNCKPKITLMEDDVHQAYFNKLSKLVSVNNKPRLLRLLHGDVFCAERRYRFGLSDSNICRRCFAVETISHLLMECPYSCRVYSLLGCGETDINDILGVDLSRSGLEIRADFLNYIVFRQHTMPPEILVQTTLEKYANGLVAQGKIVKLAKAKLGSAFA
jgi:hypothetical protein